MTPFFRIAIALILLFALVGFAIVYVRLPR
jgi:hypothetical protein